MLMLLRLLVTAFDVFALGTAIYSTSLNYYYRCIGQIYRKPACYVNILNENICFVKQILDKNQKNVVENHLFSSIMASKAIFIMLVKVVWRSSAVVSS